MEFSWKEFKNHKFGVHCKTEEEAREFIEMANKNGIEWKLSDKFHTNWDIYKKNTYYAYVDDVLMYGGIHINIYKLQIIEFSDVINFEEDNKMELKEGMIIECRNGDRYLLRTACGELVASSNYKYMSLDYDEELNENRYFNKDFDVMKIYTSKAFILNNLFNDNYLECIWERKELKKMTLAQISKALGYEVEIIDNE